MATKQVVMLKGQRDGISIMLDADADFEMIKDSLRRKVSQGKRFFDGADTKVSFKGRELGDDDEKTLIDIILSETSLDITFVQGDGFTPPAPQPVQVAAGSSGLAVTSASTALLSKFICKESRTAYYQGGLRSGQSLRYNGSIVILGDVNPGSEVVADGNVVVLGALKGMAHAGAAGDGSCFVSAVILQPTQLRIAGTISYVPATTRGKRSTAAYAYIKDGQVFIAPL